MTNKTNQSNNKNIEFQMTETKALKIHTSNTPLQSPTSPVNNQIPISNIRSLQDHVNNISIMIPKLTISNDQKKQK